jgi:transposase-like protein
MPTEKDCRDYLIQQRWDGCPVCPYCGYSVKTYVIEGGKRFKCGANQDVCGKKYSVTVGTIFESSRIPLTKWLNAVYVVTAHKKGISSHQLGRNLGVTQRTAWFMIHRIREMMKQVEPSIMEGIVQSDETFMARKYRSDYIGLSENEIDYKIKNPRESKGAVIGLYDKKTGEIRPMVFDRIDRDRITDAIIENVKLGSTLHTDESSLYRKLEYNGYYRVIAQCKKPTRKWHIWFFPTLKPTLKKPKEPFFCQRTDEQTDRQIDNYSNILYLEKRDIKKYKLNL